ncbi:MAG: hypothetical protein ACKVII_09920 [Planctomycetales bacterium]
MPRVRVFQLGRGASLLIRLNDRLLQAFDESHGMVCHDHRLVDSTLR